MQIDGRSLIAGKTAHATAKTFHAISPLNGKRLDPDFHEAGPADVDSAMRQADEAFELFRQMPAAARADLLDAIAAEIIAEGDELLQRANAESGLPIERLTMERGRTCGQLKTFAALIREGSWQDVRIDTAIPDRQPMPKPDLRRMLVPLGPVVVLGASNFPLAFSTAGGDTASALAAGCPVVVKAHPAHPGTSELTARAIYRAMETCRIPHGVFSMLHGTGSEVAQELVRHPLTRALGFTGSERAGRALFDAAAARPEPIPVFAEMGSTNPIFILPGALKNRGAAIAQGLKVAFTAGVGQFCTKPGIVVALGGAEFDSFTEQFRTQVRGAAPGTMLHHGICDAFHAGIERVRKIPGVIVLAESEADADASKTQAEPIAFATDAETFLLHRELREEIFGPYTLLVSARSVAELEAAARSLPGQLTATLHADGADISDFADLAHILERKAGRVLLNGFSPGVEVCPSMQHGGPYPATTDSRYTSVGTAAIARWARPLCLQGFPEASLPDALRNANPLGVLRMINGTLTRDPILC
jgi:NADP-dependent aldehyde dehydrogenase